MTSCWLMSVIGPRLQWKNEVEKLFLQTSAQLSPIIGFLPYLVILVIFYFVLIRPGTTRQKKLQEMIETEMSHPDWDEVRVSALKKEKLRIKDELERLRSCVH